MLTAENIIGGVHIKVGAGADKRVVWSDGEAILTQHDAMLFCIAADGKTNYEKVDSVATAWQEDFVVLLVLGGYVDLPHANMAQLVQYIRSGSRDVWTFGAIEE